MIQRAVCFLCAGLILGLILGACNFPSLQDQVPTFIPEEYLPTAVALTADSFTDSDLSSLQQTTSPQPQQDPDPTATETALPPSPTEEISPTQAPPSPSPTVMLEDPSPAALPDPLPEGEIRIISPGPLSRLTSPFILNAYLNPGEDRRVQVSLYGEDERLVVRHQINFQETKASKVQLKKTLSFEISEPTETARLEISTRDTYGRVTALASIDVVLLEEGQSSIRYPLDVNENIIIQQPIPSNLIQGDGLIVKGFTRVAPQGLVVVQLLNRQGGLVGTKVIEVAEDDLGGGYRFFADQVPFLVDSASWVRVQVIARDGRFSGIQHLSSIEVLVSP